MPHIHEKIDFTVEVFVVHNGRVLLRKHDKLKFWLSVDGHIELDEDPNQAAVREVKEEVGLTAELYKSPDVELVTLPQYRELIPPQFLNRHNITDTHEHVTLTYFATTNTNEMNLSTTEVTEGCKWFTMEELDDPQYDIKERIKVYAKSALRTLSGDGEK